MALPARLLVHDVDLVTVGAVGSDAFNNETLGELGRLTVKGWMTHLASDEKEEDRSSVVNRWKLFVNDPGVVGGRQWGSHQDQVEWDGSTFRVLGHPIDARSPRGPHHLEVLLEEVIL